MFNSAVAGHDGTEIVYNINETMKLISFKERNRRNRCDSGKEPYTKGHQI